MYALSEGWVNFTLLQIWVLASACAICKCVQCAWVSQTVPKGRSGRAKTNFFLQYLSISAPILSFCFFNFQICLSMFGGLYTCPQRLTIWPVRDFGRLSCQVTRKVETGYKPSHTTETIIGYIV